MTFPITGKTKLTQNLPGNYINVNEAVEANELINHKTVEFTIAGNRALTLAEQNTGGVYKLSGAPAGAFTLTVQDGNRVFSVWNETGQTCTMETVSGSTVDPTVATGAAKLVVQTGQQFVLELAWTKL